MNTTSSASRVVRQDCVVITILPTSRISRMIRSTIPAPDGRGLQSVVERQQARPRQLGARAPERCRSPPESCAGVLSPDQRDHAPEHRPGARLPLGTALPGAESDPVPRLSITARSISAAGKLSQPRSGNPADASVCSLGRVRAGRQRILEQRALPAPFGTEHHRDALAPRVRVEPARTAWPLGSKRRSEAETETWTSIERRMAQFLHRESQAVEQRG